MVILSGVSDAGFRDCAFHGFRGDAINLGSSTIRAQERHNLGVTISGCIFDGIAGNTRNAISVLDCRELVIEDCKFRNVGRTGGPKPLDRHDPFTGPPGPGAIDIEPESTGFAVVDGVIIRRNTFSGGGGNAVTMNLFRNGLDGTARNIVVQSNVVTDRFGGFGVVAQTGGASHAIAIEANEVIRCVKPFLIDGVKGLSLTSNTFRDSAEHAELGWQLGCEDIRIEGNVFERVGRETGFALWVRRAVGLTVSSNTFSGNGTAMAFVTGMSERVAIRANKFESEQGGQMTAVNLFAGAGIDHRTLDLRSNFAGRGSVVLPEQALRSH